jgi:hypothetical protein
MLRRRTALSVWSMSASGSWYGTWVAAGLCLGAAGCRSERPTEPVSPAPAASTATTVARDAVLDDCRARAKALEGEPALPGIPDFDARRAEILGRARGEPLLFVREPKATPDAALSPIALGTKKALEKSSPAGRVRAIAKRHKGDRETLRALLLREGYLYSADPHEALALVSALDLVTLFDEPTIFLQRGREIRELTRTKGRWPAYRDAGGQNAELLLGDRVAVRREELGSPLHRDLRSLARELGFDRARIERRTDRGLFAELRFGGAWVKAVLASDGAKLSLACFDAEADVRRRVERFMKGDAERRHALARLHAAVDAEVAEALPFDRPRGEKTAERDGQLRPEWRWAYKNGYAYFSHEEESYPVFDAKGRPMPPQMCVDFVLDSFERASGTWYRPRGEELGRQVGGFDLNAEGIKNRAGVLAFEKFAEERPKLFVHRRIPSDERIQFGERTRFFAYLVSHADDFRPGDVVAIQGRKGDGNIHQHAILIEDTDPLTGFPDALADQMKRPRRRTWEGIMAEAPLRSLLFHVRPTDELYRAIVSQPADVKTVSSSGG